ncbi:MAG TPA: 3'-5' exonuclease, partial [Thermomicrobiales bacterium]|nr:3'-5' exonuclease [Thermomicrobiales bacterium]
GPAAPARVRLATIHAAKGGEWAAVFVVGVEEGLLPHRRALRDAGAAGATATTETATALAAERHLAYVAVSRPRTRLYLTHCARRVEARHPDDDAAPARPVRPSRFLLGLPAVPVGGPRPFKPAPGEREPAA